MQEQSPVSPPPVPPAPPAMPVPYVDLQGADPAAVLQGFRAQREVLGEQLEELEERRQELSEQLQAPLVQGADRAGLEQRIRDLDARIASIDQQIADADAAVARASAVPGAVVEPPPPPEGVPEEVFVLSTLLLLFVLFPLAIAYARRIWKRSAVAVTQLPGELWERLTRLEQSVDSVAIEVERIGEGQRFVTRVLAEGGDRRGLVGVVAEPTDRGTPGTPPHRG